MHSCYSSLWICYTPSTEIPAHFHAQLIFTMPHMYQIYKASLCNIIFLMCISVSSRYVGLWLFFWCRKEGESMCFPRLSWLAPPGKRDARRRRSHFRKLSFQIQQQMWDLSSHPAECGWGTHETGSEKVPETLLELHSGCSVRTLCSWRCEGSEGTFVSTWRHFYYHKLLIFFFYEICHLCIFGWRKAWNVLGATRFSLVLTESFWFMWCDFISPII